MSFKGGINEVFKQAARLQRKIEQAKNDAKDKEVSVTTMNDRVTVVATCGRRIQRIAIDPELLKTESLDLVLDSVCAATNQALEAAERALEAEVDKATGGVKVPGLM